MGNINWEYAIGIVGVIVTVWGILYIIKPNLKYTIEILPFVNPKDVDKNIKSKLKITYDNQEVSQLSLARINICNKGRAVAENFSSPIVIKFSKKILYVVPNVEILKSGIVHEYTISNDRFRIEFTPQYINQGESIYFDAVLESAQDINVSVMGRCKGCSNIKKYKSINLSYKATVILAILTGFFIAFCKTYIKIQYENKIMQVEQKISTLNEKIINQYEVLMETETLRADNICAESKKVCAECKTILLDKLNKIY